MNENIIIGDVVITPKMLELIRTLQKDTKPSDIELILDEMADVYIAITQDELYTPDSPIGTSFTRVNLFLRDVRNALK